YGGDLNARDIYLTSGSTAPMVIGGATTNGTTGSVSTTDELTLANYGSGGLDLSAAGPLSVSDTMQLTSYGPLTMNAGTVSARALHIQADTLNIVGGNLAVTATSQAEVTTRSGNLSIGFGSGEVSVS